MAITTTTNNANTTNSTAPKKTLLGQPQQQHYTPNIGSVSQPQQQNSQYNAMPPKTWTSDPNSLGSLLSKATNSDSNGSNNSTASNWSSNLTSMANMVNQGYPNANTASRASTSANVRAPQSSSQQNFGVNTSIPYGQNAYQVQSGSNGNNRMIQMGNDGRTVNIDQSYVTSELPSYTQSEGQYGNYDTAGHKSAEYAAQLGDMSQWSEPVQKMAQEIQSYSELGLDPEHQAQIDSNYIQAQDLNQYKDRDIKEGYSAEDLAVMSQNGLDSLNNAYKRALNSAAADYNRLGLRGSGFELGNSYGNTENSITGQYLSNVQKLQNEIDSKGLEAAREDLYKNADANDRNRENAIKSGLEIGAGMNDAAMKRIENEQQIQEKNRTGYKTAVDTINTLYGTSDQSQRAWAGENAAEHKNDADAIRELISLGKQSEATAYSTGAQLLGQLFGAIGTASSGGNRDALNGAVDRINQLTNGDNSYLNRILQELGLF